MKTNEIMEIVSTGKIIPIEFNKYIAEYENRYEKGMRSYIVNAYKSYDDNIVFGTEERDFSEYNKSIEKPRWYNNKTSLYDLKWSQLEEYLKNDNKSDYDVWEEANKELINFKVIDELIDKNKIDLFNKYKEEKSELNYISWLEDELIKLLFNKETKSTEYTPTLQFMYKNWKGETNIRNVIPYKLWFGSTEFHPENQWLLRAYDIEKCVERNFALKDIIEFM